MIIKQRSNCFQDKKLSIFNRDTLASDTDFMSEERVRRECNDQCPAKSMCVAITQKLSHNNYVGANLLLDKLIG